MSSALQNWKVRLTSRGTMSSCSSQSYERRERTTTTRTTSLRNGASQCQRVHPRCSQEPPHASARQQFHAHAAHEELVALQNFTLQPELLDPPKSQLCSPCLEQEHRHVATHPCAAPQPAGCPCGLLRLRAPFDRRRHPVRRHRALHAPCVHRRHPGHRH